MSVTTKLKAILSVISTRAVGHTSLLKKGIDSYDKPFIMLGLSVSNVKESHPDLSDQAKIVSIDALVDGKYRGSEEMPVAIDNYVLKEILEEVSFAVDCMQDSLTRKDQVMNELMNVVEHYQDRAHTIEKISLELTMCPWWKFGQLIEIEKRLHAAVLSYNEGKNVIDESFNKILKISNEQRWQNR